MKEADAGWEEIADRLIRDLQNGKYVPGDKLPSENKLAGEFQVPRSGVRKAYSRLKELGYIYSLQGYGSFFAKTLYYSAQSAGRAYSITVG